MKLYRKEKRWCVMNGRRFIFWLVTETVPRDISPAQFENLQALGFDFIDIKLTLIYGNIELTETVSGCTIEKLDDIPQILHDTGTYKRLVAQFKSKIQEVNNEGI